ncbi:hypothetical protein [Arcanobacterium pluranimalium]|uniref:hypothetical protein n=1 Tax=Arcanobacterium pluranimalium TaxID=108028 RepID=UPI00195DB93C|nr:hypothetical protein [Arcanobacterium pluranimalium]
MTQKSHFPIEPSYDPDSSSLDEYIEELYQVFLNDLVLQPLYWKSSSSKVSFRKHPTVAGRHAVFSHIITGGSPIESLRQVEFPRCIRIRWIRILVELFNKDFPQEEQIRWWIDTKRSSNPRYIITRPDYDYVVVIEERLSYALLVTAYYAEHQHRRRKLQKDHDTYWKKQEPPTK